jgi:hypothetical protein
LRVVVVVVVEEGSMLVLAVVVEVVVVVGVGMLGGSYWRSLGWGFGGRFVAAGGRRHRRSLLGLVYRHCLLVCRNVLGRNWDCRVGRSAGILVLLGRRDSSVIFWNKFFG